MPRLSTATGLTQDRVQSLQVAIIFSEDYSLQSLKDGFIARANANVEFYVISLTSMRVRDAINVVRSRDRSLKMDEESGFIAVIVATKNEAEQEVIALALRRNPGNLSILLPDQVGVDSRSNPVDDLLLQEMQSVRSDVNQLRGTLSDLKVEQSAQGKVISVLTKDVDDLRDNDRVFRQDIYTRINENSQTLRDVTGGNLGSVPAWKTSLEKLGWQSVAAIGSILVTLTLTVLSQVEMGLDASGHTTVKFRPLDKPAKVAPLVE